MNDASFAYQELSAGDRTKVGWNIGDVESIADVLGTVYFNLRLLLVQIMRGSNAWQQTRTNLS